MLVEFFFAATWLLGRNADFKIVGSSPFLETSVFSFYY